MKIYGKKIMWKERMEEERLNNNGNANFYDEVCEKNGAFIFKLVGLSSSLY